MSFSPDNSGTVLLRGTTDTTQAGWLLFTDPVEELRASTVSQIKPLLQAVTDATNSGLYAAGYLAYEAAAAFDTAYKTHQPLTTWPLAWFGIYSDYRELPVLPSATAPMPELAWQPSESYASYKENITHILSAIHAGDTYQVNYTLRFQAPFTGSAWNLFHALYIAQPTAHAAWLRFGDKCVCSASPELFFRRTGCKLTCRPMKGTTLRQSTAAEDAAAAKELHDSPKNRAENVMITDMIRNDLGRIAVPGSVVVPRLFQVEPYPTVWQMTSTIEAESGANLQELFTALFPCASITGAPKIRAMEIIHKLEVTPRGIYTGAIGYVAPQQRDIYFNVAIRTVAIDLATHRAEYGTGGGIVWDSTPESEYSETLAKARVLQSAHISACLLETILWRPKRGWFLLNDHLVRIRRSAAQLGYRCDTKEMRRKLDAALSDAHAPTRVRLILHRTGDIEITTEPVPAKLKRPWCLGLAAKAVNSESLWLRHKTTWRQLYQEAKATQPNLDDVVLWNERNEITETSIANIALKLDGSWYTPPLQSGLIPGVYRAYLLRKKRIRERTLTLADLQRAEGIAVFNSLRGWLPAEVCAPAH